MQDSPEIRSKLDKPKIKNDWSKEKYKISGLHKFDFSIFYKYNLRD